jgi:cyclomaltodextrinase / maltogenic alpha-amylase / neopullulanase
MQMECFYHGTRHNWAYAYDKETVHLRVRTKRDDVEALFAITGDKYDWDRFYAEYQMRRLIINTIRWTIKRSIRISGLTTC